MLTELFIAVGLWFRRTRYAAVWIAVCFHVAIEVSAQVQVFSFLAIAALVIWAVPSTRDRNLRLDISPPSIDASPPWLARSTGLPAFGSSGLRPARASRLWTATAPRSAGAPAVAFRAQPPAADGVVRPADAAPSRGPPGPPSAEPTMIAQEGSGAPAEPGADRRVRVHARGAAGGLPVDHAPASCGARPRPASTGSSATRTADGTWLYLYNADDDSTQLRVQPRAPLRGHDGPLPGSRGGTAARRWGSADRGTEWALDRLLRAGRLGGGRLGRAGSRRAPLRCWWPASSSAARPPATRATTTCSAGSGASLSLRLSRRVRCSRRTTPRTAGPVCRRLLQVLHRRGVLGAGAPPPETSPTRIRAGSRDRIGTYLATSRDEVEDHLAADPRSLGGLRDGRDGGVPRARPPAAHRGRGGLRAAAGRAVRGSGALGGASASGPGASWCAARHAPGRRLRRDKRGAHGMVARRWGGAAARGPRARLSPSAPPAPPSLAVRKRSDPRGRREGGPAGASRGRLVPSTARPAWTTSSTRWRGCCARSRSSRLPVASGSDDDAPLGLAVGGGSPSGVNPSRAAFAVPREGRSRRAAVRLAVAGGAIGGLVVVVAALIGDPLLDLLDVSEPSFRLAAGIVAAVAGAADLFAGHPRPSPRCPAGARRSSRSPSQRWRGRRSWCWPWERAPTTVSSRASERCSSASRCSPSSPPSGPRRARTAGPSVGEPPARSGPRGLRRHPRHRRNPGRLAVNVRDTRNGWSRPPHSR